ncbi:unnamed protein product [Parajaminaea phylloscopi]
MQSVHDHDGRHGVQGSPPAATDSYDHDSTKKDLDTLERDPTAAKPEIEATEVDVFAADNGGVDFRTLTWPHAAVIVAKLQIGVGVLGIPGTFDTLGFVPGLISLIILSFITTYAGILAGRIRLLHPNVHSAADLADVLYAGNPIARGLFTFFYWIMLVMIAGSGILSTTIAFNAVSTHALCTMAFAGIVAAACILIGGGMRQLMKVAALGWVGIVCVMLAIWILTIAMLTKSYPMASLGQTGSVEVLAVNKGSTFAQAMAAVVTQLFALLGNVAYYSISAEMRKPADFDKAVYLGQGFAIVNYLVIGCIVYSKAGQFLTSPALGSAGPLIKKICYGFALPAVLITAIMYTHMATKQMFVLVLRRTRHLTTPTATHWAVWLGSNILVVAIGFVLAASIPVFDDLLSLIGSTVGAFFAVMVAGLILLYMIAREEDDEGIIAASGIPVPHPTPCNDWSKRCIYNTWRSPNTTWRRKMRFFCGIFFLVAAVFLIGGGTYGSVTSISKAYSSGTVKQAFACDDNSNSV